MTDVTTMEEVEDILKNCKNSNEIFKWAVMLMKDVECITENQAIHKIHGRLNYAKKIIAKYEYGINVELVEFVT